MAFSSVVNLGAAPSGGYLVAQPVSTVETAAANPTATVLRPMSTTVGATIDGATLAGLTALMSGVYATVDEPIGAAAATAAANAAAAAAAAQTSATTAQSTANSKITKPADAAGALTNDGAGNLSWVPLSGGAAIGAGDI